MKEEILKNNYLEGPAKRIGSLNYYSLGETTIGALQEANLICSRSKKHKNKKPDALITDDSGHVVAYIENKDPAAFKKQNDVLAAIDQEIAVAASIKATVFIATDTYNSVWVNPATGNLVLDTLGNPLRTVFNPYKGERKLEKLLRWIELSLSRNNDKLIEESLLDPSDLASSVHQKLWLWKHTSPETSLYAFIEIFLFKYLSDLGVLKGDHSFNSLMAKYDSNSEEYVLDYYLGPQGPREQIKTLFPAGEDKTTVINGDVFHVERDADGAYIVSGDGHAFFDILTEFVKYEQSHGKFVNVNRDFKSRLFESFLKEETDKKRMGQFFTPLKVVQQMVRMADIRDGMKICDPACGVGKFLLEAAMNDSDEYLQFANGEVKPSVTLIGYDRVSEDNSDRTIVLAKANMLIYLSKFLSEQHDEESIKRLGELINNTFRIWRNTLGTLWKPDENEYDLILTNPPYVVNGSGAIKRQAMATGYYEHGGLGLEALFCEWVVKSLKAKGQAFIVVPDGLLLNLANNKLREYLLQSCFLRAIVSLPINTFFGTPKKTYILVIEKRARTEVSKQTDPVFVYLCNSIGETLDANRFDIDDNDLETAVNHYRGFRSCADKSSFVPLVRLDDGSFKEDGKCKLVSAGFFWDRLSTGWDVEAQWSEQERINLGLKRPGETVSVDEFMALVNSAISALESYRDDLKCLLR